MTTQDALLRSILTSPQDDTPRLVYADWLEENGDGARSEFVRVQVELARLGPPHKVLEGRTYLTKRGPRCWTIACEDHATEHGLEDGDRVDVNLNTPNKRPRYGLRFADRNDEGVLYEDADSKPWAGEELRRRERELWHQLPTCKAFVPWATGCTPTNVPATERFGCLFSFVNKDGGGLATVSRGFIDVIQCNWSDWLQHEAALYWSREQTVECRCMLHNPASMQRKTCVLCKDGRINRPFVPTAQPLSVVRLTDDPVTWTEWHTQTDHFYCEIGTSLLRFDRVKCATCDGNSSRPSGWDERPICPQCQGRPLNSWTCEERWAGLAFEMPEVR